jgi:hypothetical protein
LILSLVPSWNPPFSPNSFDWHVESVPQVLHPALGADDGDVGVDVS